MAQIGTKVQHTVLSRQENEIARIVVGACFNIHKTLGPGLLESVYKKCLQYELTKKGLCFRTEQLVPIWYDRVYIEQGLRLDFLVEELVIIEIKAQENTHPVWEAQLLSYLKLTGKRLGLIVNFHVPLIKHGIKRMII
jgi:GxxExxY protein